VSAVEVSVGATSCHALIAKLSGALPNPYSALPASTQVTADAQAGDVGCSGTYDRDQVTLYVESGYQGSGQTACQAMGLHYGS
jgi:hypothetical protein